MVSHVSQQSAPDDKCMREEKDKVDTTTRQTWDGLPTTTATGKTTTSTERLDQEEALTFSMWGSMAGTSRRHLALFKQ